MPLSPSDMRLRCKSQTQATYSSSKTLLVIVCSPQQLSSRKAVSNYLLRTSPLHSYHHSFNQLRWLNILTVYQATNWVHYVLAICYQTAHSEGSYSSGLFVLSNGTHWVSHNCSLLLSKPLWAVSFHCAWLWFLRHCCTYFSRPPQRNSTENKQ